MRTRELSNRMVIKVTPEFSEAVAHAANAEGATLSEFMRAAIRDRMESRAPVQQEVAA